jgi:hypothetical protein
VIRAPLVLAAAGLLASCAGGDSAVPGHNALAKHVESQRIGSSQDQWIEMRNAIGEWERTGLIFGYTDDYGECIKAIAGLKAANHAREYRCVPAN